MKNTLAMVLADRLAELIAYQKISRAHADEILNQAKKLPLAQQAAFIEREIHDIERYAIAVPIGR